MKYLIFFVAITTHLYDVQGEDNAQILNHMTKVKMMFAELVKQACYKNSTQNVQRFKELLDNSTTCLMTTQQQAPLFVTPQLTFKDNIQNCINDVIEELENCLPDESKDLPQLDLDVILALIDFAYENKEQLLSPQLRTFADTCVANFKKSASQDNFLKCFNFNWDKLELKSVCQELVDWEKCFQSQLNKTCPSDESVEKLKIEFFRALKEPCAEFYPAATEYPSDLFTLVPPLNINPDLM